MRSVREFLSPGSMSTFALAGGGRQLAAGGANFGEIGSVLVESSAPHCGRSGDVLQLFSGIHLVTGSLQPRD